MVDSSIKSIRSVSGNIGPYRDEWSPLWDWGPHDLSMCLSLVEEKVNITNVFHETDKFEFKEGYENRRINITMLFGERGA